MLSWLWEGTNKEATASASTLAPCPMPSPLLRFVDAPGGGETLLPRLVLAKFATPRDAAAVAATCKRMRELCWVGSQARGRTGLWAALAAREPGPSEARAAVASPEQLGFLLAANKLLGAWSVGSGDPMGPHDSFSVVELVVGGGDPSVLELQLTVWTRSSPAHDDNNNNNNNDEYDDEVFVPEPTTTLLSVPGSSLGHVRGIHTVLRHVRSRGKTTSVLLPALLQIPRRSGHVQLYRDDSITLPTLAPLASWPAFVADITNVLWTGLYATHPREVVRFLLTPTPKNDGTLYPTLIGVKLVGDPNVPSNEITFAAAYPRRPDDGKWRFNPAEPTTPCCALESCGCVKPAESNSLELLGTCPGLGQVAATGFRNPTFVAAVLQVFRKRVSGELAIVFTWFGFGSVRLSPLCSVPYHPPS